MSLATGLVAYWKLDEASGTRVDSHASNDLTDNNTVTQAAGKIGNAAQFTRANQEYLSRADNADLSTGDIDYWFTAWVYLDSKPGNDMTIVSKDDGSPNREYRLYWEQAVDRFRFFAMDATGASIGTVDANTFGAPSTSTWYFVVGYHSATDNEIGISVNGGAFDTAATTGAAGDSTGAFYIGLYDNPATKSWDGRIDEVGFWKRAKPTANEVAALYNGGNGLPYSSIIGKAPEGRHLIPSLPVRGERIVIEDSNQVPLNDPRNQAEYSTQLMFESMWPKGFGIASFRIAVKDIFGYTAIDLAQNVMVYDGTTIVYQGRINQIDKIIAGGQEFYQIQCTGWYVRLEETDIVARWIDTVAITSIRDFTNVLDATQREFGITFLEQTFLLQMAIGTSTSRASTDRMTLTYDAARFGQNIRRVTYDYFARTGEGLDMTIYNVDQAANEDTEAVTSIPGTSGSVDHTFTQGDTTSFEFRVGPNANDNYDPDDYSNIGNVVVYFEYQSGHSDTGTPEYQVGQLIEDLVLLANISEISSDVDGIDAMTSTVTTMAVEEYTAVGKIAEEIAKFTADDKVWGIAVWDRTGASDDLPKVYFTDRNTDAADYIIQIADTLQFDDKPITDQIQNFIRVRFTDKRGRVKWRIPADNASLKDQTSIDKYGQRSNPPIRLGKSDNAGADAVGEAFLAYHKDPIPRVSFTISGFVRKVSGEKVPVSRLRAGQRVKVAETGDIYWLRHTRYDAETKRLSANSDVPPENLPLLLAQQPRALVEGFGEGNNFTGPNNWK